MHSRRSVLAGCGALTASTALSGCSFLDSDGGDGDGGSGGGGGDGGGGGGGGDRGQYTDWSHEVDADLAAFSYAQIGEIASVDGLPDGFVPDELLGIPVEDMDHQVTFQSNTAYEGSFDAGQLRSGLESQEGPTLEEDGEQSGYQLYTVSGQQTRVGIRDGRAVVGPADQLATFIDAGAGDVGSLVDANEDFDDLTSELGSDHSVSGQVKLTSDAESFGETEVAKGSNTEFGAEDIEFTQVTLFETAEETDEQSVRGSLEGQTNVSDLSVSTSGRVVTATFTRPTDSLA